MLGFFFKTHVISCFPSVSLVFYAFGFHLNPFGYRLNPVVICLVCYDFGFHLNPVGFDFGGFHLNPVDFNFGGLHVNLILRRRHLQPWNHRSFDHVRDTLLGGDGWCLGAIRTRHWKTFVSLKMMINGPMFGSRLFYFCCFNFSFLL